MIAISLLMIASGAIGLQLYRAVEKKRWSSGLERFRTRLLDCRQLAINMQADWKGSLTSSSSGWVFEAYTLDDAKINRFPPLKFESCELYWKEKRVSRLSFLFASGGEVRIEKEPEGEILFVKKSLRTQWQIPALFHLEGSQNGAKTGPLHPDDLPRTKS